MRTCSILIIRRIYSINQYTAFWIKWKNYFFFLKKLKMSVKFNKSLPAINHPNKKQLSNDSRFLCLAWNSASFPELFILFLLQLDQKLREFLRTQTIPPTNKKVGIFSAGHWSMCDAPISIIVNGIKTVKPIKTVTPTLRKGVKKRKNKSKK